MVRNYKRKLPQIDENKLEQALEEIKKGKAWLSTAKKYGIPRSTLKGRMKCVAPKDPQRYKRVRN